MLKPPKNIKSVVPRVCGTCSFFVYENEGWSQCRRPDGPTFDTGDGYYWYTTCDKYMPSNNRINADLLPPC